MIFASSIFLFLFLPILIVLYFLADRIFKNIKIQNIILLVFSLIFYSWGEPKFVILMLLSIFVNYCFGLTISHKKSDLQSRVLLIICVIYNLSILFVFKYLNFSIDILNSIGIGKYGNIDIKLPIGISFFTFQILSYVIEVYRGNVKSQKNILDLGLYISFFPQLIAGPIVRYNEIEKYIHNRVINWDSFFEGVQRFSIGFSKKILIADRLAPFVDSVFSAEYPSLLGNWAGMISYTLQIYYDFSGYSDMAIGLGKMFGFDFPENFNYPYISKSIKEFWRRWHISLSSWFKDYVYIPLGGNRKGNTRKCINLLIVFFLTGLWHGAATTFVVWGLYYAIFIILENSVLKDLIKKLPSAVKWSYTILVVMIGWVFFRADSIYNAGRYIIHLFVPYGNDLNRFLYYFNAEFFMIILVGILFSAPIYKLITLKGKKYEIIKSIAIMLLFILSITCMIGSGYSPFLYFRF